LKRRKRWGYSVLDEIKSLVSSSDPARDTENSFHSELLQKSLAVLTPRQHAVVIARVYQDLPFAEISKALGCSENSAKVHFHEGKKRIESFIMKQVG